MSLAAFAVLLLVSSAYGFYIPGVAPTEYKDGDSIEVQAVKLVSARRPLPYQYYYLPFCRPAKIKTTRENLGEVLRGDRITNTPYVVEMATNKSCSFVCGPDATEKLYTKKQVQRFERFIQLQYRANWLLDNLPAATKLTDLDGKVSYTTGFPLGYMAPTGGDGAGSSAATTAASGTVHLFNHLILVVKYHDASPGMRHVVGFEVRPRSVASSRYSGNAKDLTCEISAADSTLVLDSTTMTDDETLRVVWSYSVLWEPSNIPWSSRWDAYLAMGNLDIHWYSLVNALATVFLLSGILGFVLVRSLRRDIARYNDEDQEEAMEQTGWKLIHGDVFRAPAHALWLSIFIGSGIQLFSVLSVAIVFSMLGMLSPASRGSLITAVVVLFVLMGVVGGYYGARFYKTFKGASWTRFATMLATFYPGVVCVVGMVVNVFVWGQGSSAVPFTTMLALLFIWFGASLPCVFGGAYFGYRKQAYEFPCKTNQIPRQIPEQMWYMNPVFSVFVAGILPFGAVFIELYFILTAVWENQVYYLFGFLFLVFVILVVTCSEIAIVMTYLQLCAEDYHWWWRTFFVSGGCSLYVFLYAVYYYMRLGLSGKVGALLYFGYTGLMVLSFWLLTGAIGFFVTWFFVRRMYGSVKID